MELYICRLKLDNVEKSFELQREKKWKQFPAKRIANFWGREGEQAVISSNRVWGGMCLWKSNFKISQKTITGAIFVSPIPKSPPQHNPLMYLGGEVLSKSLSLSFPQVPEQRRCEWSGSRLCCGDRERWKDGLDLTWESKERVVWQIFMAHWCLFSGKRFK